MPSDQDLGSPGVNHPGKVPCHPPRQVRRTACCAHLSVPVQRPDPAIYSQVFELGQGREPSWDNPDIRIHAGDQRRFLEEPEVTVHNRSATTPAVGVRVGLAVGPLGIGMELETAGWQKLDLPAGRSVSTRFVLPRRWRDSENLAARVALESPVDANPENNRGEQATVLVQPDPPDLSARLSIPVRNASAGPRELSLSFGAHRELIAALPSPRLELAPFEQRDVHLQLIWPVPPTTSGAVTLFAHSAGGALLGGVTLLYEAFA